MLWEALVSPDAVGEEAMRHAGARFFGTRDLKDTLQISRCALIENASNSPKVVGRDNHRPREEVRKGSCRVMWQARASEE